MSGGEQCPAWLTEDCPSWCTERHADSDRYNDRTHTGMITDVILTAEEPPMDGVKTYEHPTELNVYMIQHYREAWPRIWIGRNGTNEGMYLTLDEAGQLMAELRIRADQARQE